MIIFIVKFTFIVCFFTFLLLFFVSTHFFSEPDFWIISTNNKNIRNWYKWIIDYSNEREDINFNKNVLRWELLWRSVSVIHTYCKITVTDCFQTVASALPFSSAAAVPPSFCVWCLKLIIQQVPSCPAAITALPTAMFMVARVSVSWQCYSVWVCMLQLRLFFMTSLCCLVHPLSPQHVQSCLNCMFLSTVWCLWCSSFRLHCHQCQKTVCLS